MPSKLTGYKCYVIYIAIVYTMYYNLIKLASTEMALNLNINNAIIRKLKEKHEVTVDEVEECFYNRIRGLLEDTREQHKTNPPTMWFVAETNQGRLLKVVFIELDNGTYEIKTAYAPYEHEVKIYEKYA